MADRGLVDKSIDLEDLLKKEMAGKGKGQSDSLKQRLSDAHALIFNTLQDLKQLKAEGNFAELKDAKKEVYENAVKCKVTSEELNEFLDFLGDVKSQQEQDSPSSRRRRYNR